MKASPKLSFENLIFPTYLILLFTPHIILYCGVMNHKLGLITEAYFDYILSGIFFVLFAYYNYFLFKCRGG